MSAAPENSNSFDERGAAGPRPYIGVLFKCCGIYTRVYRRAEQKVYQARCPRCLRAAQVRVGEKGTNARIFEAM